MCGRFARRYSWRDVHDFFDLASPSMDEMKSSYNVAPTQVTPVCRLNEDGRRELAAMRWGLIPHWAKDASRYYINARSESASTSPAFRSAYRQRRCLVPASGFFEWKKTGRQKQPFYVHLLNEPIMCFAGLWEPFSEDGGIAPTFTILTTRANEALASIHHRMPVIVDRSRLDDWLNPDRTDDDLFAPIPPDELECYPVSTRVNSARHDDASNIEPVVTHTLFD